MKLQENLTQVMIGSQPACIIPIKNKSVFPKLWASSSNTVSSKLILLSSYSTLALLASHMQPPWNFLPYQISEEEEMRNGKTEISLKYSITSRNCWLMDA